MEVTEVLRDLTDLVGKRLESIGGRSDLVLRQLDPRASSWRLTDSFGRDKSRPLSEIEIIWDSLRLGKPVHVESALLGSGSSRNQPETLMANLPYVEWARIGRRKHLIYVRRCSHEPGTLRRMDAMAEADLQLNSRPQTCPSAVVITSQLGTAAETLVRHGYTPAGACSERAYRMSAGESQVLIVASELAPTLDEGIYPVLQLGSRRTAGLVELPEIGLAIMPFMGSWVFAAADHWAKAATDDDLSRGVQSA